MTHENDPTKNLARPALVIAGVRSGGTYLAHCLSNHPQVFCDRGESLHHDSLWHRHLKVNNGQLLYCLLHMQGYHVSMCKLTYNQAFAGDAWQFIKENKPPIIFLTRENVIRQSVSLLINRAARGGKVKRPQHTFRELEPLTIGLSGATIIRQARGLQQRSDRAERLLAQFPRVLKLKYRDITDPDHPGKIPANVGKRICGFLGVRSMALKCDLKRVNAQPLSELIRDWPTVEEQIKATELAYCLGDQNG